MDERTIRARMLLGDDAMDRLRNAHVAVFGLGGVGSWCAETLARSGVEREDRREAGGIPVACDIPRDLRNEARMVQALVQPGDAPGAQDGLRI